jgi:hypothetical protein
LKSIKLSQYLKSAFVLVILTLMCGCGSSGGSTPNEVVKGASLSVVPSSNSEYVIQGNNLEGVAAMDLIINYDNSILSSPAVTEGGLVSGSLFVANAKYTPSSIKIAFASTKDISGTGQIATVSFAAATGPGSAAIVSATTINSNGKQIPLTF